MSKSKKAIIILMILVVILFVIPFVITYFTHSHYFGKRVVHENNYYEYLVEKNPTFKKEVATFASNENQILEGGFYYKEGNTDPKALIIWVHGMSVNYENYLAEILYLTNNDYIVFSYDNTGVNKSEGENLKGLTQAPIDLQHALKYIYSLEKFNDIPNILIGHSWGGFSVSTVSELEIPREVDGIVSIAGFYRNINVIEDIAKYYVGDIITLLVPYLSLYEKMLFGEYSKLNAIDGLLSTNAPVLMLHSKEDVIVSFESNFLKFKEVFSEDSRFTFKEYENAGHKLTINKSSYDRIHDIMHHQMKLDKNDEHYIELENERLSLITDFNLDVMNEILNFCDSII